MATSDDFRVLIAEDEPHIRRTLRFILEREGLKVICAENGEQALAIALESKPDLILMDVIMPGRNGLEILKELRSTNGFETVPVILLTALSEAQDKVRGLEEGADDYLTKPFDPREVVARVRAHLRLRRLQNEAMSAERVRVALETAGGAAHEMSQPLTVMMGNLDLLLMKMRPDDPLRHLVEKIRSNGVRASGLLRRLQSVQSYATKSYLGPSSILDLERSSEAVPAEDATGNPAAEALEDLTGARPSGSETSSGESPTPAGATAAPAPETRDDRR